MFDESPVLDDVPPLAEVGLVTRRLPNGQLAANLPQVIKYHSPTGFEVGYGGSGPADLALNVLHLLIPPSPSAADADDEMHGTTDVGGVRMSNLAFTLHQEFKQRFIATMDADGGVVPLAQIHAWIAERTARLIRQRRERQPC